jgi:group II intron reverse transcriptase/maturase
MQTAVAVLNIIRERGKRGLGLERLYRQLFNRDLFLRAYAKLYPNKGAMTPGSTSETVDGMALAKIDAIIQALREERYHWTPVRRTYITKRNGKRRPLGLPSWSDKLLCEVIRSLLEAYYEPGFSDHSHGFRAGRGCHTALQEITHHWRAVKWFVEGDLSSFFERIDHQILLNILREQIHDNRFIRLLSNLLKTGYLEEWKHHATYSGTPQGSVLSPILSNLVLNKLDWYVERELIPIYNCGKRRRTYAPYVALTKSAWKARKQGDRAAAKVYNQQAQKIPSRDPFHPNFRRLWYTRYADDFALGLCGPKSEAMLIKQQLTTFLEKELKLELNQEKTLITHARTQNAKFLGYEIQAHHADDKHDWRGQRCINASVGLGVPKQVIEKYCKKYMRRGKPVHLPQRMRDSAYSIVATYQTELQGIVQYYRLAHNVSHFSRLKGVMQASLVKTLAGKFRTSVSEIYRRYRAILQTEYGSYKVLEVKVERGEGRPPLVTHFGGIPMRRNQWVTIGDELTRPIWSKRSEIVQRLLAQQCELCGSTEQIEVHHLRKLADLERHGKSNQPEWVRKMAVRKRKTLVVCQKCHNQIHYGRYNGPNLTQVNTK